MTTEANTKEAKMTKMFEPSSRLLMAQVQDAMSRFDASRAKVTVAREQWPGTLFTVIVNGSVVAKTVRYEEAADTAKKWADKMFKEVK